MGKQGAQKPTQHQLHQYFTCVQGWAYPEGTGSGPSLGAASLAKGVGKCAMKEHRPTGTRPQFPKDRTCSRGLCPAEDKAVPAEDTARPGRPTER